MGARTPSARMGRAPDSTAGPDRWAGGRRDECHGSHEHEDYLVPTKWSNPSLDGFGEYSFDNLGAAVLCLFEAGAQLEP